MNRRSFLKSAALGGGALGLGFPFAGDSSAGSLDLKTRHLIFIVNGNGARKKDYYEDAGRAPNIVRMAREGFVFEEDHCDQTASHASGFAELLQGRETQAGSPVYPTLAHYIRAAYGDEITRYWHIRSTSRFRQWSHQPGHPGAGRDLAVNTRPLSFTTQDFFCSEEHGGKGVARLDARQFPQADLRAAERKQLEEFIGGLQASGEYRPSLRHPFNPASPFIEDGQSLHLIPRIMAEFKPRVLIFQQVGHDCGHGAGGRWRENGYEEYLNVVRSTDESIGRIVDWVKNDPYFSRNTAIVLRPDFGRDDEINAYGEIHHSPGYYYTQRVASIFWGPDFNRGVDRTTVINRRDTCPTLTKLFNVDAKFARGQVVPGLFKATADRIAEYREGPSGGL